METLHAGLVPRHPHRWWWWLLASQCAVVLVYRMFGWQVGVPFMVATHLPFWWGVLHPRARLYGPRLARLPTDERVVWLTIDDGPSVETRALLDLLDSHQAKATFFLVGERAAAQPELVREIVARGHDIGNHSASHPQAVFWALGPRRMRAEITRTQDILSGITGTAPRWFRAVVGMANPFVAAPLRDLGLVRVAWSARGYDGVAAEPSQVVGRIERSLAPGAIVLMHEGAPHGRNLDSMRLLLRRLDTLGYHTVLPDTLRPGAWPRSASC